MSVRGVLLDIEGTTTPLSFVHEVLFPYSRSRVKDFLIAHRDSPETETDLATLRKEHAADVDQDLKPPELTGGPPDTGIVSFVAYVHWLIDRDRKSTGLKSLQGRIWREGYLDGTLKSSVFTDVAPALKRWCSAGLRICIFSSGSVLAQKLLFAHSDSGDLTGLIDHYFDTTCGPKIAIESYRRIAAALDLPPEEILFISDVVAELDAASAAGMRTLLCVRPGNQPQPPSARHPIIQGFDEIAELGETISQPP